ncbi:Cysteine proteinase inhibitor 1 [Morus notabilis]|uniref:Cysteine proteinase inhibitor 1 n=1 Tax=Morus notabilis TaxID=981085 RepID=W9QM77_9ROSA|nr:cysteine proteinase inhibitor 1 [Morus notabilis]EXB41599.1 Cysteine proteinase inhibitor 1 [Morus notabilis]
MATMRTHFLLLIVAVLVAPLAAQWGEPGGWTPIKDLSDPHLKEIVDFAISEYNRKSNASLKLNSVVEGETQVVEGMNYHLIVTVANGAALERYEAVVWEMPWQHFISLTSFSRLGF